MYGMYISTNKTDDITFHPTRMFYSTYTYMQTCMDCMYFYMRINRRTNNVERVSEKYGVSSSFSIVCCAIEFCSSFVRFSSYLFACFFCCCSLSHPSRKLWNPHIVHIVTKNCVICKGKDPFSLSAATTTWTMASVPNQNDVDEEGKETK